MSHKQKYIDDVLDYILSDDREIDDFEENPSTTHVYYKTVAVVFDVAYANEMLEKAIAKQTMPDHAK